MHSFNFKLCTLPLPWAKIIYLRGFCGNRLLKASNRLKTTIKQMSNKYQEESLCISQQISPSLVSSH